jgi:preprotein translocase subunit SecG
MESVVLVVHVLLAIGVISLVLLQHGRGADAGAAFGSGSSSTVFGSRGASSFLSKMTTMIAALFFVSSLGLALLAAQRPTVTSVTDTVKPAAPAPAAEVPIEPKAPEPGAEEDLPKLD